MIVLDTTLFERNVNTLCFTTHVSRWVREYQVLLLQDISYFAVS
jgi:hypothetical protein